MPTEVPVECQEQIPQPEMHRAVRSMRAAMGNGLPLRRLARSCGTSPAALCLWENGRAALPRRTQVLVSKVVREEFGKFAARVAALASQHGVAVGSS